MPHTVLIVDSNPAALTRTARVFRDAGYHVMTTASFESARWRLRAVPPDLLVTDVRLGDYNGIHLVIRGRSQDQGLPAIVTDVAVDRVLEADAATYGAVYMARPQDPHQLVGVARGLVENRPPRPSTGVARRWPRLAVPFEPLPAVFGDAPARVLDLSYGGLRLEVPELNDEAMRTRVLAITPPWFDGPLSVRAIWARRPSGDGAWWCGVEIDDAAPAIAERWRTLIDSLN
jgi:two-component system response regulator RegA